ncbi:CAP-associated domain-containing protein [Solibacillus sp. FSL K6-1523]|uniref:CAP-associated domain-containing protein n=1 Tax=Solibacillus sp. FSL K6-1523 TaxID=2921471 RepID=UPI0030F9643F
MKRTSSMMGIIIPILFSATLIIASAKESDEWDSFSDVAVNKKWTITFNKSIAADSVKHNVYIQDQKANKIAIQSTVSDNKLTITPTSNLQYDTNYKVVVTNNLNTTAGKSMNQGVIIPFKTVANNDASPASTAVKSFPTEYDFTWDMPTSNYKQFNLVGTKNGQSVAGYETTEGQSAFDIQVGSSRDTVIAKYGEPLKQIKKNLTNYTQTYIDKYDNETSGTYLIDNHYVTFFYDAHKQNKVRSITWVDARSEMSKPGFFATPSDELREGFEHLMVELINQARVAEGLQPLTYTPGFNGVARKHSASMANNNFFGHVDLAGGRGGDRMKNGGVSYSWWGENLAYGQYSAIYAHEALMNSLGHRENILRKEFTHIFVGVEFNNKNQPYFTMNFYSI